MVDRLLRTDGRRQPSSNIRRRPAILDFGGTLRQRWGQNECAVEDLSIHRSHERRRQRLSLFPSRPEKRPFPSYPHLRISPIFASLGCRHARMPQSASRQRPHGRACRASPRGWRHWSPARSCLPLRAHGTSGVFLPNLIIQVRLRIRHWSIPHHDADRKRVDLSQASPA